VKRVQAVIFDWAGTTVDHGSLAPVRAMKELFARHRVDVADAEIRRDMGLFKKDHIRRILAAPHIDDAWRARTGLQPNDLVIEALFAEFQAVQMEILEGHADLIGSVADTVRLLRGRGIRVGSTTGYTRPMLDVLLERASAQGYIPEISLCPDDVGGGRPRPWMCLRIALEFRLDSMSTAVKVGDTVSDIEEGLNAGMWTIGVSRTGNEAGLGEAEFAALTESERAALLERACETLRQAGAHEVVESVAALEAAIAGIDRRLAAGERP
jgi:phosphonoacetaldehyde hydrolase